MKDKKQILNIMLYVICGAIIINLAIILCIDRIRLSNLKHQIEERNELIRELYNDNFVLDYNKVKFIESITLNDSISHIDKGIAPKKLLDSELRTIHNLMQDYVFILEEKNYIRYAGLFREFVPKFFLRDSVNNMQVLYHMQWYWKTYPNAAIAYDLNSMSIHKDFNGYNIFLPSQKEKSDIITEIRLDKDFKIYYIRDYHAYLNKR